MTPRKMNFLFNALIALTMFVLCHTPSFAEPPNLSVLKKELQTYHDSGLYNAEIREVIASAHDYMLNAITENQASAHPKKLAVVLDIDETSLSNYQNIIAREFTANKQIIHENILKANAPAIEDTLQLFNELKKHHVAVFFITGREASEKEATVKNLHQAGFNNWDGLMLRPSNYHKNSITPYKSSSRTQIAKQGYTIVANIGDQYSDLIGGHAKKGFKLPNPYYYLP